MTTAMRSCTIWQRQRPHMVALPPLPFPGIHSAAKAVSGTLVFGEADAYSSRHAVAWDITGACCLIPRRSP